MGAVELSKQLHCFNENLDILQESKKWRWNSSLDLLRLFWFGNSLNERGIATIAMFAVPGFRSAAYRTYRKKEMRLCDKAALEILG